MTEVQCSYWYDFLQPTSPPQFVIHCHSIFLCCAVLQLIHTYTFLQNCLWGASGMDATNEYQSMIVYHHNAPWWSETIRLAVPIDKFYGSHIRLEYRHCSSKYWCCWKCDRLQQSNTCTKTPILHSVISHFP